LKVPLKITETIVAGQDALVASLRAGLKQPGGEHSEAPVPEAAELDALVEQAGPQVQALVQERARLQAEHARTVDEFFK
jgi:hypothetical protein